MAVAALLDASLAVQVIVVVPTGNPDGALLMTVGAGSLSSVTVGVPREARTVNGPVDIVVMSGGAAITGGVVSGRMMVTV